MKPFIIKIPILLLSSVLTGCSGIFEYSPYDADVSSKNLNTGAVNTITSSDSTSPDTLKFAFFSDSHEYYDELNDALGTINTRGDVQFVICGGDVADMGLAYQFEWYTDVIGRSDYPLFTVIGNHDCRSSGKTIYKRLFGPTCSTFTRGAYKFVIFDDIIWENYDQMPDYEWLASQLADTAYMNVVVAHIPPWDDQLEGSYRDKFIQTVTPSNTILCLHGHEHNYSEKFFNGIHSLVAGSINRRYYYEVTLVGRESYFNRVTF